jgi:hypothetical protein
MLNGVRTLRLRGTTCAFAEKAAHLFLHNPDDPKYLKAMIRFGALSHLSMDAPKKVSADKILEERQRMAQELGLSIKSVRSTWAISKDLLMSMRGFSYTRSFEWVQPGLKDVFAKSSSTLGNVWLPSQNIYLGEEAGKAIMEVWLTTPSGCWEYFDDSKKTSPLLEIAGLLQHRAWRTYGSLLSKGLITQQDRSKIMNCFSESRAGKIDSFR